MPGSVLPTLESLGPPAESGDGGAAADRALADLVGSPDTGVVEFAQEDTGKHVVPVKTKAEVDIQRELEKLRAMTAAPAPTRVAPASAVSGGRDIERRLKDMIGADQTVRHQVKRKAAVEVPGALLKGGSGMKILLAFIDSDGQEVVHEAAVIGLRGNQRLEWLALQLELDVKGKG